MTGLRAATRFLAAAAAWTLWSPATVDVAERDPDRWADAAGMPEVPDPPRSGASLGLDPEPHRAAIERMESVVYRRGPADFGDAEAVSGIASRLAQAVMGERSLAAHRAGTELLALAARAGAAADVGYAMPDLPGLRREWEAVRDRVFRPAPWMRRAAPELDRLQDPPPPPPDPRTRGAVADATRDLERLMARGLRDAERLGEPRYDPDRPGTVGDHQIRAWYEWGERWRQELRAATAPLHGLRPEPHAAREPLLFEAKRSVEEAAELLRRVPDGAGMWPTPFRTAWEARFRAAAASLARTRSLLAQTGAEPRTTATARER